jgi:hypothetical protein
MKAWSFRRGLGVELTSPPHKYRVVRKLKEAVAAALTSKEGYGL